MSQLVMLRATWRAALGPMSRQMVVSKWGCIIAAVLLGVGRLLATETVTGAVQSAAIPLSILAILYWNKFVTGAAIVNQPERAGLVPSLNRRVRHTAVLTWLLTMLPFVASGVVSPNGLLLLTLGSLSITAFGLHRAGRPEFRFLAVAALAVYCWVAVYSLLQDVQYWSGPSLTLSCLLTLPFAGWAVGAAFPRGGEVHWAMLQPHARAQASDSMEGALAWGRTGKGRTPVYTWLLERDVARGSRDLWLHVLGRNSHRLVLAVPLLIQAACLLLFLEPVLRAVGVSMPMNQVMTPATNGLLGSCFFMWRRFCSGIRSGASEQALVRLAPAAPRAVNINRRLGASVLFICLAEWFAVLVLVLGLSVMWDGGTKGLQNGVAMMLAVLSLTGASLGDHSRKDGVSMGGQLMMTALCFAIALFSTFMTEKMAVWLPLVGLILALSVGTIAHRWRVMMAAPVAFPAGRFA